MAPVQIDLNTRILDKDHNVFVARPGKNYRFYPDFHAEAVVFPDLPALGLKDGQTLDTYDDLTERVLRARAVRSWHRRGMPDDDKPSRNLADYKRKKGRSAGQLEGVVRGYFERAAKGDLVVVPPKGYRDPALIGEFLADPKEVVTIKSRFYTREEMSARRVKWLGSIEKRKLVRPVLDALEKPNALFLLEKGFRDDIYEVAYGNYILGDDEFTARFDISSPVFTVDDELLLQSFFKFVAVNVRSIENNQGIFGYKDTVFMPAGDYVPYLQTDIHSPGTLILNCPRLTPLVASIMFALAISVGPQAIELAKADQIVLKNSKAALHDPCTARVREESMQFLRLLELDQWTEACDKAREVEKRTGAQSPSKVK